MVVELKLNLDQIYLIVDAIEIANSWHAKTRKFAELKKYFEKLLNSLVQKEK